MIKQTLLCYKFFNNAKPKTYYDVIGVSIKATQPNIKKAYFEIVKRYHPDHNKDKNAEETFKEIVKAYETLKDPIKRQLYDLGLNNPSDFEYNQAGQGFSSGGDGNTAAPYFKDDKKRKYYENRWYSYQKPKNQTQHEEFEEYQQNFQKMDQQLFLMLVKRALLIIAVYGLVDFYRYWSSLKHKQFINTQAEILLGQITSENLDLENYIQDRQDEWEL